MSESEEVKVNNFNKIPKRPIPKSNAAVDSTTTVEAVVSNADIGAKLDQVNKHLQAIDWKLWVYLKAHNYIS